MKLMSKGNNIEIYSTHSRGKSVAATKIISTLKNKIYKYITDISNIVYIDKLTGELKEHNKTIYRSSKMRPVDVNSESLVDFPVEFNTKKP